MSQATLILQYLKAAAPERTMLRVALPTIFTDELISCIEEADVTLAEARAAAQDATATVNSVDDEGAKTVSLVRKRAGKGGEIAPAVRF